MSAFPTSTTVLDSILFRDAFGTPAMREVFSDFSLITRYAEVEIALARAEARCGVIPAQAAEEIAKRKIPVIASEGFMEEATSENVMVGTAMARRSVILTSCSLRTTSACRLATAVSRSSSWRRVCASRWTS